MAMNIGAPKGKPGRATPSMNVTPLVDVVLVLLIIFMVITPLMARQFWIHLPNQVDKDVPAEPDDNNTTLVVKVTKQNEILVNSQVISESELPARLKRMLAAKGDRTIFFDADEEAEFGKAVSTMDLARAGGANTIAVLTAPLAK
ncbi:MAG TPA: biopolymer transporter ExbD [Polyangiales bacterium]|nr:biopolymer transporter ExbD [Polyangiales bacterium]